MKSASDVYFAAIRSAITIEPESNPDYRKIIQFLGKLDLGRDEALALLRRHADFRVLSEHVLQSAVDIVLDKREQPYSERLEQEFRAFCTPSGSFNGDLWVEEVSSESFTQFGIAQVMAVRRLREVRAIVGFQRGALPQDPTFTRADDVQQISQLGQSKQFPAYENRGEGIFLRFSTAVLRGFLGRISVRQRAQQFRAAEQAMGSATAPDYDVPARAAYVLAHSLAHITIRQIALTCGYSQSSLRERIFVSSDDDSRPWAGFLVYTSSSDADGSLGGLVAQAVDGKLAEILAQGIETLTICSSDPMCALQVPRGFRKLNGAACHSCLILPETCCERNNRFLDRVMVIPGTINALSRDLCYIERA